MNDAVEQNTIVNVFENESTLKEEIIVGLSADKKHINPKFFYDEYGSMLFERITKEPEYYPTRTEMQLLTDNTGAIADAIGRDQLLIEPGAGSCEKVTKLLGELSPTCFIPIDISAEFLQASCRRLMLKFPHIDIRAKAGDMLDKVSISPQYANLRRTVFYPGSTIGNYEPANALAFLKHVRQTVGDSGGLLIGVDLQKDERILNEAYNDRQGVTALFNLNILNHVNALLDTSIQVENFEHLAFYNQDKNRIEMHLESKADQTVALADGRTFVFSKGELIQTEYSYKYTVDSFTKLAEKAGFTAVQSWVDKNNLFSLQYLEV